MRTHNTGKGKEKIKKEKVRNDNTQEKEKEKSGNTPLHHVTRAQRKEKKKHSMLSIA